MVARSNTFTKTAVDRLAIRDGREHAPFNDSSSRHNGHEAFCTRKNNQYHLGAAALGTPTVAGHPIEPDNLDFNYRVKPEDNSAVGQLLSWVPPPPSESTQRTTRLFQPVIVPQLDVPPQGESTPFARCYSDALAPCGVPISDFLAFLDGLAVAQASNTALQGLKMFGVGARSVPLPLIPLAGRGISALATSGAGHSGGRAKLYLARAKKGYFVPRGLNITIVRDDDLSARLGIPSHAARLAPLTKNTLTENCFRRRLSGLAPYVAPLRFNVPEPDNQLQGVHKLARKHLESRFKSQAKELTKLRERQWQDIAALGPEAAAWEEQYGICMTHIRRVQEELVSEQVSHESSEKNEGIAVRLQTLPDLQRQLQLLESQRHRSVQQAGGNSRGAQAEMDE